MTAVTRLAVVLTVALLAGNATASPTSAGAPSRESPFRTREVASFQGPHGLGVGVAYGMHRDGQRPGGPSPSRAEMLEDLRIIARDWDHIRIYGAHGPGEVILDLIQRERLPLKVMLGVWVTPDSTGSNADGTRRANPQAAIENRREIETAVQLTRRHRSRIHALVVGNETQIEWSVHRSPVEGLIRTIRELRARTALPVTTADDFNFWNKPRSREVAAEVDLIVMHAHPLWNGLSLENAVPWLEVQVDSIQRLHPDRRVVLGETGWATMRNQVGDQGRLIKGAVGEAEQKQFREEVTAWARRRALVLFEFEAFDENWKGSDDPAEVEKHWGLYRADRTPKAAMQRAGSR